VTEPENDRSAGHGYEPPQIIGLAVTAFFGAAILLWVLYEIREVLIILYVAGVLAIGFSPIVRWIERRQISGNRKKKMPRWLAILILYIGLIGMIALVLALGRYGGLDWVITHLPVLRSIRGPVRYVVLVQFALAVLAAITMDDLLAIARGAAGELRRFASVLYGAGRETVMGRETTVADRPEAAFRPRPKVL